MQTQKLHDRVDEIENVFIAMADGTRLAARVFLPKDAGPGRKVPVILEYIPYRKRDLMRARDETMHRYFAASGYAVIRADIRGTGDSEGLLHDEYTKQEQDDALAIIDWAAKQEWSTGNVGMMGISWGGFNALQVAARRPPALKAIITACSTDDRYADDVHYMGGCLLHENMQWGGAMTLYNALPPDPEIVGGKWRQMWRERLENLEPLTAVWMAQQTRGAYWKHGSVCEDYSAIACPVYAVGGWADGYSNAVPRLLENLKGPRKGLIGPWAHSYPHNAVPGPAIGFLQEAVRWWDHWLKGSDTGIMDEPQYRVFMEDYAPLAREYGTQPGRWVAETQWPSPRVTPQEMPFIPAGEHVVSSPVNAGKDMGAWCGMGHDGEQPGDQREDDAAALVFDMPVLSRTEIMGAPELEIEFRTDKPAALAAVKLCDVAKDGTSRRVSYGLLNLTHRHSHETPEKLVPGTWHRAKIKLNDCAYAFEKGHKIRLSIATSCWPLAWPSPEKATLTLNGAHSSFTLPVRPPQKDDAALRPFDQPVKAEGGIVAKLRKARNRRTVEYNKETGETIFTQYGDCGELGGAARVRIEDIGLETTYNRREKTRIKDGDPLSARVSFDQTASFRRDGWEARIELRTKLRSTKTHFHFSANLKAFEGKKPFIARQWRIKIPRNHI